MLFVPSIIIWVRIIRLSRSIRFVAIDQYRQSPSESWESYDSVSTSDWLQALIWRRCTRLRCLRQSPSFFLGFHVRIPTDLASSLSVENSLRYALPFHVRMKKCRNKSATLNWKTESNAESSRVDDLKAWKSLQCRMITRDKQALYMEARAK